MAQLVAAWMAVWLILAVCLTQELIDATSKEEALTNFKFFKNIKSEDCNSEGLERRLGLYNLSGFAKSLGFAMRNRKQLSRLYKSARISLEHYLTECGLEGRYQKLVQQSAANRPAQSDSVSEPTLAAQLLSSYSYYNFDAESFLWAIMLVKDTKFPLAKIKCDDDNYVEQIARGLKEKNFSRLKEYALELFNNYLTDCGHESNFKQIIGATSIEKDETLSSYLRKARYMAGFKLVYTIKLVDQLASIAANKEPSCDDLDNSTRFFSKLKLDGLDCPRLMRYARRVLIKHIAACIARKDSQSQSAERSETK